MNDILIVLNINSLSFNNNNQRSLIVLAATVKSIIKIKRLDIKPKVTKTPSVK